MSETEQALEPIETVLTERQASIWDTLRGETQSKKVNFFSSDTEEEQYRQMILEHKAWLGSVQHECPSPFKHYRIGVYIRFFNQTKYDNYLDYHKQQFIDTITLCPNWKLIDFYVDEGQNTPHMENCKGWSSLLEDCFAGKIDLIITQKISNVSNRPQELTFCARILAALKQPVGIYFINEDMFTLASYYQLDLRDARFLPNEDWQFLPCDECDLSWGYVDERSLDTQ